MPKVITSTELQKQTRDTIDYVRIEREPVIIETHGRPMAVMLSYDQYQDYLEYSASQAKRAARFAQLREAAEQNQGYNRLSEDEAGELAEEARQELSGK